MSILNTLSLVNGVDTLGLTQSLAPINVAHVAVGGHIINFSGIAFSLLRSCDSLMLFGLDTCGLGIGSSILLTSILMKSIFLPVSISSQYYMEKNAGKTKRIQQLQLEMSKNKIQGMKRAVEDNQREMFSLRKETKLPIVSFLRLLEFPMHFFAMSSISKQLILAYKSTGALSFLWMSNLSIPDPFFILPILTAGLTYLMLRRMRKSLGASADILSAFPLAKYALPVIGIGFLSMMPAYVCLYSLGLMSINYAGTALSQTEWFKSIVWGDTAMGKAHQAIKKEVGRLAGKRRGKK